MSDANTDRSTDDLERYRRHSVMLNSMAWKLSLALGDASPDDESCEGDVMEQVDRAVAIITASRAAAATAACEGCDDGQSEPGCEACGAPTDRPLCEPCQDAGKVASIARVRQWEDEVRRG